MKIWRKNSVKWTLDGKRVSPNTEGAVKKTIPSKRYYGTIKTYYGKRKQTPLTEDAETSRQLLRRLQAEEDRRMALGIDRYMVNRQRPLDELLTEYEGFLRSKNNTERHVSLTTRRRVTESGVKDASDDPDRLKEYFVGDSGEYDAANIACATGEPSGVFVVDEDELDRF